MEIFPTYDHVLCTLSDDNTSQNGSIIYVSEKLPVYRIVKVCDTQDDLRFNVDDLIISNSIPTKLNLGSIIYYLIKIKNIVGKIYE